MSKRQKRPKDKFIEQFQFNVDASGQIRVILTATYPFTIVGINWELNFRSTTLASDNSILNWCLNLQRDGADQLLLNAIPSAAGNSFLVTGAESDVIVTGQAGTTKELFVETSDDQYVLWRDKSSGFTKSMRKLQTGDELQWNAISDSLFGMTVSGIITIWVLT